MASKLQILSLYKSLLREADKFYNYNFRHYALRRIRDAFKEKKNITDPKEIQKEFLFALDNLATIKRQVSPFERETKSKSPSKSKSLIKHVSTEPANEESMLKTHMAQCSPNVNINQPYYMIPFTAEQYIWRPKATMIGEIEQRISEVSYPVCQPPSYFDQNNTMLNSSYTEKPTVCDSYEVKEASVVEQHNKTIDYPVIRSTEFEKCYQMDSLSQINPTSYERSLEINDGTHVKEPVVYKNSQNVTDISLKQASDIQNNLKTDISNYIVPIAVAPNISEYNVPFYSQQTTAKEHVVEQNSLNQPMDSKNWPKINDSSFMYPTTEQYNTRGVDGAVQRNNSYCIEPRTAEATDSCSIQPAKLDQNDKIFFPQNPSNFAEAPKIEQHNTDLFAHSNQHYSNNFFPTLPSSFAVPPKPEQFDTKLDSSCNKVDKPEVDSTEINDFSGLQATTASADQNNFTIHVGNPSTEQNGFIVSDSINKDKPIVDQNGSKMNDSSSLAAIPTEQLNTAMSGLYCAKANDLPNSSLENPGIEFPPAESTSKEPKKEHGRPGVTQQLVMQQYLFEHCNTQLSSSPVEKTLDEHNEPKMNISSFINTSAANLSGNLSIRPSTEPSRVEHGSSETTLSDQKSEKLNYTLKEETITEKCNAQKDNTSDQNNSATDADSAPLKIKYNRLTYPNSSTKLHSLHKEQPMVEQRSFKVDSYSVEPLVEQKYLGIDSSCMEPTVRCSSLEIPEKSFNEIKLLEEYAEQLNKAEQFTWQNVSPFINISIEENNSNVNQLNTTENYGKQSFTINNSPGMASPTADINVPATHSPNIETFMGASTVGQNVAPPNTQMNYVPWTQPNVNEMPQTNENYSLGMHSVTIDVRDNSVKYTPCVQSTEAAASNPFCPDVTDTLPFIPSVTIDMRDNSVKYSPCMQAALGYPCQPNIEDNTTCMQNINDKIPHVHTTVAEVSRADTNDNKTSCILPDTVEKSYNVINNNVDSTNMQSDINVNNTPHIFPSTVAQSSYVINNNMDDTSDMPAATVANTINDINHQVDTTLAGKPCQTNINDNDTPCKLPATVAQCSNAINNMDNTSCIPAIKVAKRINDANNHADTPTVDIHTTVDKHCRTNIDENNTPRIATAIAAMCSNVTDKNEDKIKTTVEPSNKTVDDANTTCKTTDTAAKCSDVTGNNENTLANLSANINKTADAPDHSNSTTTSFSTAAACPNVTKDNIDEPNLLNTTIDKSCPTNDNNSSPCTVAAECSNVTNIKNDVKEPLINTKVPCHTDDNESPCTPTAVVGQSQNVINMYEGKFTPYMHTTVEEPCYTFDNNTPRTPTAAIEHYQNVISNNTLHYAPYMHKTAYGPCYKHDDNTSHIPTAEYAECTNVINTLCLKPAVNETFIENDNYAQFINTTAADLNNLNTNTYSVGECTNYNNTFYIHPTVGESNNANLKNASCMQTSYGECAVNTFCMQPSTVGQYTNVNNTFYMHPTVDENNNNLKDLPLTQTDMVNESSANMTGTPCMTTEIEAANNTNPAIPGNVVNQSNTAADVFDKLGDDNCMIAKMATIQQCCADITPALDFAALEDSNLETNDDFDGPLIYHEFWYHQPHFQADLAELDY